MPGSRGRPIASSRVLPRGRRASSFKLAPIYRSGPVLYPTTEGEFKGLGDFWTNTSWRVPPPRSVGCGRALARAGVGVAPGEASFRNLANPFQNYKTALLHLWAIEYVRRRLWFPANHRRSEVDDQAPPARRQGAQPAPGRSSRRRSRGQPRGRSGCSRGRRRARRRCRA